MKKKTISRDKILSMHLLDFNIRPVDLWTYRQGDALGIRTIRDLVKRYPYVFQGGLLGGRLGEKPIEQLKKKLLDLGLTPNDWPALVSRNDFLDVLSKEMIKNIPITEVFAERNHLKHHTFASYFGCKENGRGWEDVEKEVAKKTVADLLQIDPTALSHEHGGYMGSAQNFFNVYKDKFVRIHQKLTKKGFGISDGPFFNWNPESEALNRTIVILNNYNLRADELNKFSKIVVAERWVI
jgi:hypothetical protein